MGAMRQNTPAEQSLRNAYEEIYRARQMLWLAVNQPQQKSWAHPEIRVFIEIAKRQLDFALEEIKD